MGGGGVFQKPVMPKKGDFMTKPTSGVQTKTGALQRVQNSLVYDDESGAHPGKESGYGITRFEPFEGNGFSWTHDPMTNKNRYKPSTFDSEGYEEAQGIYKRAEERRQEKLDAMAGMAGGKGEGSQAPRPPGQGQPGQFQVKSTPMVELKRRFPSLEQTEGSLNPFLERRYKK